MVNKERFRKFRRRRNFGFPIGPLTDTNIIPETRYDDKIPIKDIEKKVEDVARQENVQGLYIQKKPAFDREHLKNGEEVEAAWKDLRKQLEEEEKPSIVCKQSYYALEGQIYTLIAPIDADDESLGSRAGVVDEVGSLLNKYVGTHGDAYSALEIIHETQNPLKKYVESVIP